MVERGRRKLGRDEEEAQEGKEGSEAGVGRNTNEGKEDWKEETMEG